MPTFQRVTSLLRQVREKLGLTQEQFAQQLGVTRSRYVNWEQGLSEPRFSLTEWRRFRALNPQVFDAMMTGTLEEVTVGPSRVAKARDIARRAVEQLAEEAGAGSRAAEELLTSEADRLLEKAGNLTRVKK